MQAIASENKRATGSLVSRTAEGLFVANNVAFVRTSPLRFPGTVLVERDAHNNPPHASVALVFQLTAADRRFVKNHPGSIAETTERKSGLRLMN